MPAQQTRRYREIVERFDEVARASVERLTSLNDLCSVAGVSHRTLNRAFRAIRGTTPTRYLHALRLSEARRTLTSEDMVTSVTEVATRFGFRELGRFAGEYRAAFGESPSETLRRRGDTEHARCR